MERRFYDRVPLYTCCVIIDKNTGTEYQGTITDISEGGLGFLLDDYDSYPRVGSHCSIQFIDVFADRTFIISEVIQIINASSSDGRIRLGAVFCKGVSSQCISFIRLLCSKLLPTVMESSLR